jgi:hypothetical protein
MPSATVTPAPAWGDLVAISLQELRTQGKLAGTQPLIRIDYRAEAARAPLQFDPVAGLLHRTNCRVIPSESRSALFARWELHADELMLRCPVCRPGAVDVEADEEDVTVDVLYGLVAIIDQFGAVLRERGKEYRNSEEGRRLQARLELLYTQLDEQQRKTVGILFDSLDQLVKMVQDYDLSLRQSAPMNGHHHSGTNGVPPDSVNGSRPERPSRGAATGKPKAPGAERRRGKRSGPRQG